MTESKELLDIASLCKEEQPRPEPRITRAQIVHKEGSSDNLPGAQMQSTPNASFNLAHTAESTAYNQQALRMAAGKQQSIVFNTSSNINSSQANLGSSQSIIKESSSAQCTPQAETGPQARTRKNSERTGTNLSTTSVQRQLQATEAENQKFQSLQYFSNSRMSNPSLRLIQRNIERMLTLNRHTRQLSSQCTRGQSAS